MFFDIMSFLLLEVVPLAVLVGLIVSIVKFVKCPKENTEKRKKYKTAAIVFGIILGIMVIAFFVLMLLLAAAITHM